MYNLISPKYQIVSFDIVQLQICIKQRILIITRQSLEMRTSSIFWGIWKKHGRIQKRVRAQQTPVLALLISRKPSRGTLNSSKRPSSYGRRSYHPPRKVYHPSQSLTRISWLTKEEQISEILCQCLGLPRYRQRRPLTKSLRRVKTSLARLIVTCLATASCRRWLQRLRSCIQRSHRAQKDRKAQPKLLFVKRAAQPSKK